MNEEHEKQMMKDKKFAKAQAKADMMREQGDGEYSNARVVQDEDGGYCVEARRRDDHCKRTRM